MAVSPNAKPVAPPPGVKSSSPAAKGAPPGDKGAPPPAASGKPLPPKPGEEVAPPPGGKPDMPPGKSAPTDAKTPAPGPGGPQPTGKGAPPPGPPPGPEPGYSQGLDDAIKFLKQYIGMEEATDDFNPGMADQLMNMPEGPDQIPDQMNRIIPKGTGNQRIGTIPAPNLPTGQMPNALRSANPGVQLVGGLPLEMVKGMQMKMGDEAGPGGQQSPSTPSKKPPPGVKGKTPPSPAK